MNQRDDSSSCRDVDRYQTISALLSSASAVAAVAVRGRWVWIAELAVIAAQLVTDLRRQRHTRRPHGSAHPALPPCATVPKLPGDYLPDWIAVSEYPRDAGYSGGEGPCPGNL